ncbi:MAG TPA: S1 RNA-binding domain-containing protein, partial [Ktedonobacterales bacterium]
LAWSRVNHPSEVLKVGQKVEVQVLSVDKEKKKIALSIKRAEVDPWTTVEQRYHIGQLVTGTITKIAPFGAFARIEDGVEGLIHLSELPGGVQDPKTALHEGEEVTVRILRIEPDRRRLGLSIKAVDETAAAEGEAAPEATAQAETAPAEGAETTAAAPAAETPKPAAAEPARPAAPRQPAAQQQPEAPATAMAAAFQQAMQAQTRDQNGAETEPAAAPAATEEKPTNGATPATAEESAPAESTATADEPKA